MKDKVAIVTGAGRGIGRAVSLAFARQGASVIVADIQLAAAEAVCAGIAALGRPAAALLVDVSSEEQTQRLIAHTLQRFHRIDILVNNAGVVTTGPLWETTLEVWERTHAVNLRGVFLCTKAVLPSMIAQRSGRIVNIASVAGKRGGGLFGNTCYASSKGGVIAFTKGAAREAGPYGVTVNAIAPAMIDTEMIGALPKDIKQRLLSTIPLGRKGSVEDVAAAACFLASDAAAFITGEIMDVDGGLMMD